MTPTLANVAVPIFFPHPLFMLLALLPIAWVETSVLRRPVGATFRQVFEANVMSTLCGLPIAYASLVLFGAALSGGDPYFRAVGFSSRIVSEVSHHGWFLPLAMEAVILPCFALSVILEGRRLKHHCPPANNRTFWKAILRAHCFSYLLLLAVDCLWFSHKIV